MVGVIRVDLETEEDTLEEGPVDVRGGLGVPVEARCGHLSLLNGVCANSGQGGHKRSVNCGCIDGAANDQRGEDSSEVLHLFLSLLI